VSVAVPDVATVPLHDVPVRPPLAWHDVALEELHVNVIASPSEIVAGVAVSVAVAGGAAVTVTTA
jgi:predicted short-subunit dehydrogenase-like oxidoreductase (DUF2520 family)